MPPDAKAEEVAQWLEKAREDLRAAQLLIAADPPLTTSAAFHCQQAVEKALKGLVVHREKRPTKTHNIQEVAGAILDTDPDFEQLADDADWLSPLAVESRYPGDVDRPDLAEVREALELAQAAVAKVSTRVATGA